MAKPITKLINLKTFREFFNSSSSGGIILLICVVISLLIANTNAGYAFKDFLESEFGFEGGGIGLRYSVLEWINDGLMAIFFLLVGLEIKREIVEGELSSLKQASLPVLAAIGGVVAPALIFSLFNNGTPTSHGWGIPMATDIAFALGIISLLGNKVPNGLKVFLAALAIVDDLMAILVIAIFYTNDLHLNYLMYAGIVFLVLIVFNRLRIKNIFFYIIPGIIMWYLIHHSGIHATIAGVLTALTLPTTPDDSESPLEKLEHALAKPVNFIIMPIFAIANTNITFLHGMVSGLAGHLGLGIVLGLFIGKPLGIFTLSWLSVKAKIAQLPSETNWKHVIGMGMLGGIGFTMSIFISILSFDGAIALQTEAKFAILVASLLSGIVGVTWLSLYSKKQKKKAVTASK
ncbi:Na+/H+ antiporter NhaA [Flavobacterium rhizosphaerae]|uniref:Na(+)/H(+) antiporter NhaA n=1 Tax=Flavobacterium rhizosphaerae TaxID=3163298 RepID=A0ABW8YXR8_9FLAO